MNVIAADDEDDAARQLIAVKRGLVRSMLARGDQRLTDEEADMLLATPQGM